MFSGLLNARIKAAQAALKDGRLDEAFRLATAPDIRPEARGAEILTALGERFFQRAREHFAAERFTEALLDLEKAETAGCAPDRVTELRSQIRTVAGEVQRQEHSRRVRLEAARQRIDRGSLDAGRRILNDAPADDPKARQLRQEAQDRQERGVRLFAEAERLLAQGRSAEAADRFRQARRLHPQAVEADKLESRICAEALGRAGEALETGRLAQAADALAGLGNLGQSLPQRCELEESLRGAQAAGAAMRGGRFAEARQAILRLLNRHPAVEWIRRTADELKGVDEKLMALSAGPLGEVAGGTLPLASPPTKTLADTIALPAAGAGGARLPECLLLLVDGGGSYLLHSGERVTIGRAASSRPADVGILSDLAERHAEVARMEEDYFLFSPREVEVNGTRTKQALLADGDRVALSRNARFTFRLPSRRSPSAALDLSDGTKMPDGVRRVILFRGHAIIGFGPTAHAAAGEGSRALVLYERAGQLWVRPEAAHRSGEEARPVAIGEPVEFEGVSFVVTEARRHEGT